MEDSLLSTLVPKQTAPERPPVEPIMDGGYEIDVLPYHGDADPNAAFFLHYLWKRMLDDGLIELYFPGNGEKSYCDFVKLFSGNTKILLVVRKQNDQIIDTIGFASWDPTRFGPSLVGMAGFIFLREFWNRHTTLAAARRIEHFWFEDSSPRMDMALGIIAEDNRAAQMLMHRLGWIQAGVLPGLHQYAGNVSAATIWYLTRADFEQLEGR